MMSRRRPCLPLCDLGLFRLVFLSAGIFLFTFNRMVTSLNYTLPPRSGNAQRSNNGAWKRGQPFDITTSGCRNGMGTRTQWDQCKTPCRS
jgi:hypothetical protein